MNRKYTLEEVKSYIESFNYKLLSTEYKNSKEKLELQCPKGHIYKVIYNVFQRGYRCPECNNKMRGNSQRLEYINVKNRIEDFSFKWLSGEYINAFSILELQCPEGHIFKKRFNDFQQGHRCLECFNKRRSIIQRASLIDVMQYIKDRNYVWLSGKYKNNSSILELKCPEGHIFKMYFRRFKNQNCGCPECALVKGWSKPEKEIAEYVKTIYSGTILENDRTQVKNYWTGKNLELDIFLPDVRKAIEFNGEYWHSSDKSKWYDEMKKKQCIKKNIDLLVIKEQDWYDDKVCYLNKINDLIERMS